MRRKLQSDDCESAIRLEIDPLYTAVFRVEALGDRFGIVSKTSRRIEIIIGHIDDEPDRRAILTLTPQRLQLSAPVERRLDTKPLHRLRD